MDSARLRDDLKGLFRGELLLDEVARALYATDASLFRVEPLGVAVPRDEEDLQRLVVYAADRGLPLVPRGAGTGVAGEALGAGLVVDLSVHFRAIGAVGAETVRVQPGVVLRELNAELARHGRRFAPDPASAPVCTLGGMLATNASGSRACLHGYTRDHVSALRVVWDTGAADDVHSPTPISANGPLAGVSANGEATAGDGGGRTGDIVRAVTELIRANAALIDVSRPRTAFNRCGYLLHDVLAPAGLDLPRLLVGSEGTLAFFTEATLRTIPLPAARAAVLFAFPTLESALRAAEHVRPARPAVCDLLDRRVLSLARAGSTELAQLVPAAAEAVLLVEFEADNDSEARDAVAVVVDRVQQHRPGAFAVPAFDEEGITRLWRVREAALPALHALSRGARPLAFVEDVGVPPEELPEFVARVQAVLRRAEVTASFVIHAAAGQVHVRPFLDLDDPKDVAKLWPLADQLHALALEMGGTVSTQHGTGIARTPWVERQYGRLFPVLRELKRIFDPRGILNPGKIVGPDPRGPAWPLRQAGRVPPPAEQAAAPEAGANGEAPAADEQRSAPVRLLLWQEGELADQVAACNGCGECRTGEPGRRMCPIFRVTHAEPASPRAKANLLRELLGPGGDPHRLSADEVREVADLCINCRMCAQECPSHVNVPKLMLEAKAAHQAEHGLDRTDWVLARTEGFAALGSNFALTVNALLSSRVVRWLLERVVGVSRRRRLPAFAPRNFLKRARRRGWTGKRAKQQWSAVVDSGPEQWSVDSGQWSVKTGDRGQETAVGRPGRGRKVAYFIDVFANYNDPLIAESAVAVLHHHGFEVHVPPEQLGSGMAPLAQGDLETARDVVGHNVCILAELVREGYTVVCTEPTAALLFREDAPGVVDDPDVRLVAENTVELTAFLAELHHEGRLRTDFQPLNVSLGHHVPCHLKALGLGVHAPELLALIPGIRVHTIDVSCSGMAGTFGLKAANYAASMEAGAPMLRELARPRVLFGSTECSACRMQMENGSGKRTLHPVQYLALAYGLVPEVAGLLRKPVRMP